MTGLRNLLLSNQLVYCLHFIKGKVPGIYMLFSVDEVVNNSQGTLVNTEAKLTLDSFKLNASAKVKEKQQMKIVMIIAHRVILTSSQFQFNEYRTINFHSLDIYCHIDYELIRTLLGLLSLLPPSFMTDIIHT